jgi:large subunit ribosomal protein L17
MRHRIAGGQLNRTSAHRQAMRRNLAASLFEYETISTTLPKAKHVRSFAEKLITLAKKGDLNARRRAISILGNRDIVKEVDGNVEKTGTVIGKLFSELGPRYLDRKGGYTRIIKLAKTRLGDNTPLVLLQLVGQENLEKAETKGKKKALKKKTAVKKEEAKELRQQLED